MLLMLQPAAPQLTITLHKNGHRKKDVNKHKIKSKSKTNLEHLIKHPFARLHVTFSQKAMVKIIIMF